MNVMLLTSSFAAGGAERVAATLCNAWAGRGDSVTVVPTFSGGGEPFYALDNRVELLYLATVTGSAKSRWRRQYLRRLLALRRIIKERQPDVVVSFLPNVNIAALAATAFSGIPCIVCERSDPTMVPVGPVLRAACRVFYRTAELVTVQTEAVEAKIRAIYGGLKDVAVVPNPLPQLLLEFSASTHTKARRTLLSLGRLSAEKRVSHIIESFAQLVESFPDWDLHIYGDGPLRKDIERQIVALGLQDRVLMMGHTSDPWCVMSEADVFLMASMYEGFPNALLEAMGVGLACVTTDCPSGPREITRNGTDALLVAVDDVHGFRNALAKLMSDSSLRRQLAASARKSVIERYSLDIVLARWDAIFKRVGCGVNAIDRTLNVRRMTMAELSASNAHEEEVSQGKRFEFGKNWSRFLHVVDEARIQEAVDGLKQMLQVENLAGKSFLDIGSGSGLFSLAARRLGAKVFSFDYDPRSVACTQELKRRYFKDDKDWVVQAGSVLDKDYLSQLGSFDFVYSWGVLHHTGDMWAALANVDIAVGPQGKLFIALYNHQPFASRYWTIVKRTYNKYPISRPLFVLVHLLYPTLPGVIVRLLQGRKYPRGMSVWYDLLDWLGGYPFEVSKPEQVLYFYQARGYRLCGLKTVGGRMGCNEFVFERMP